MKREVSRELIFQGKFTLVNLPEFLYETSLYVFLSLYRFSFTRGDVNGNCSG